MVAVLTADGNKRRNRGQCPRWGTSTAPLLALWWAVPPPSVGGRCTTRRAILPFPRLGVASQAATLYLSALTPRWWRSFAIFPRPAAKC